MEKNEFWRLENMCQFRYVEAENCFHVCSQENHPIILHNEEEFKAAMNVVAFVAFQFPDLRIYTFEIMDNHFHFVLSGKAHRIQDFANNLVAKLSSHPSLSTSRNDIRLIIFKKFEIENLENLRNVIAYVNRNGTVVMPDENVFTYRWGANRFFYNREARERFKCCGKTPTIREKRELFHSNLLAGENKIVMVDGYVSPMCYCYIGEAELFFRNNRHYFFCISKNIESSADIAKTIGESIFYSDEDLFSHIKSLCVRKYRCSTIAELPQKAKIEIAKDLRFNYNAGNKQISRLLKLELPLVSALFPERF